MEAEGGVLQVQALAHTSDGLWVMTERDYFGMNLCIFVGGGGLAYLAFNKRTQ